MSPQPAHLRNHRRQPRRLLTNSTPAAGLARPIIDSCDNLPHVGDWQCWRQLSKQVLPWRSKKLGAVYDPKRSRGGPCRGTANMESSREWEDQSARAPDYLTAFASVSTAINFPNSARSSASALRPSPARPGRMVTHIFRLFPTNQWFRSSR